MIGSDGESWSPKPWWETAQKRSLYAIFSLCFSFVFFYYHSRFYESLQHYLLAERVAFFFCCHYSNTEFRSRFFLHGGLVHHNLLTGFAVTTLDKIYVSILVFMHLFPYLSIHPFIPTFISFPVTIASLHHSPILFFYYIFRSLVFFSLTHSLFYLFFHHHSSLFTHFARKWTPS